MNVVNQNKFVKKLGAGGWNYWKNKKEKQMSNKDYAKYIFWIVLSVIIMSTLSGS